MAQSQFDRIPISPETEARHLRSRIMELRAAKEAVEAAEWRQNNGSQHRKEPRES